MKNKTIDELENKISLIKSLIKDLYEQVSYNINISEHISEIRKVLLSIEIILKEQENLNEK